MKHVPFLLLIGIVVLSGCGEDPALPTKANAPQPQSEVKENSAGEAWEIIEQAIEAHGGKENLERMQMMRIKAEAMANYSEAGQPQSRLMIEDVWQMPDQYRSMVTQTVMGKPVKQIQTINGDKGWISLSGKAVPMPEAGLKEMKEQKYAEDLDRLLVLNRDVHDLAVMTKEEQVNRRPAVGVRVQSKGHRDVVLYFDKETHLLVKRKQTVMSPLTNTIVPQEVVFSNHDSKDGVIHWNKIVVNREGKKYLEGEVVEVEFLPKIDAKVFAMPMEEKDK